MRTRRLGDAGPELTTVGFGAWAIGGPWRFGWGDGRRRRVARCHPARGGARRQLDRHGRGLRARPLGGGCGACALSLPVGDDVFVFTKCGRAGRAGPREDRERPSPGVDPRGVRAEPAPARGRAHRPLPVSLARLDDGHARSRIRGERWPSSSKRARCGGSASQLRQSSLDRCDAIRHVDSVQPPLSLLARGARHVLPWAASTEQA